MTGRLTREDLRLGAVFVGKNGRRRQIRRFQNGFPEDYVVYDVPEGGVSQCTIRTFLSWADRVDGPT